MRLHGMHQSAQKSMMVVIGAVEDFRFESHVGDLDGCVHDGCSLHVVF